MPMHVPTWARTCAPPDVDGTWSRWVNRVAYETAFACAAVATDDAVALYVNPDTGFARLETAESLTPLSERTVQQIVRQRVRAELEEEFLLREVDVDGAIEQVGNRVLAALDRLGFSVIDDAD